LILVNYVAKEAPYSSEIQPTMTNDMQREPLALYSGEIENAITRKWRATVPTADANANQSSNSAEIA
jgi:hypothetical protein